MRSQHDSQRQALPALSSLPKTWGTHNPLWRIDRGSRFCTLHKSSTPLSMVSIYGFTGWSAIANVSGTAIGNLELKQVATSRQIPRVIASCIPEGHHVVSNSFAVFDPK